MLSIPRSAPTAALLVSTLVACGGGVSLGDTRQTQSAGSGASGDDAGAGLCPLSDCAHQGMACTFGAVRDMRCVPGAYPAVGDACTLVGHCQDDGAGDGGDASTALPCVRACSTTPSPGGPCAAGDVCRVQGTTDEYACVSGAEGGRWMFSSLGFPDPICP